jgi:hypothetical protein
MKEPKAEVVKIETPAFKTRQIFLEACPCLSRLFHRNFPLKNIPHNRPRVFFHSFRNGFHGYRKYKPTSIFQKTAALLPSEYVK